MLIIKFLHLQLLSQFISETVLLKDGYIILVLYLIVYGHLIKDDGFVLFIDLNNALIY